MGLHIIQNSTVSGYQQPDVNTSTLSAVDIVTTSLTSVQASCQDIFASGVIYTSGGNSTIWDTVTATASINTVTSVSGSLQTQIDNNDLDIASNTSAIATVSGATVTNASNIAANTSSIDSTIVTLTTVSGQTITNASNIASNTSTIATVSGATATNASDIASNTSAIATVSGATVTNASDIASNTSAIATVSGATVTNAVGIASNASNFSNYLPLSGGTLGGDVNMGNFSITDVNVLSATEVYAGSGTSVLYVDSNKVGINTSTPNADLTVQGTISSTGVIYTTNDIHITDATKGLILTSPASGDFRITVTNSGTLTATSI
jgi:hypothetical protein